MKIYLIAAKQFPHIRSQSVEYGHDLSGLRDHRSALQSDECLPWVLLSVQALRRSDPAARPPQPSPHAPPLPSQPSAHPSLLPRPQDTPLRRLRLSRPHHGRLWLWPQQSLQETLQDFVTRRLLLAGQRQTRFILGSTLCKQISRDLKYSNFKMNGSNNELLNFVSD